MSKSDFIAVTSSKLVQWGIGLGLVASGIGYLAKTSGSQQYLVVAFVLGAAALVLTGVGFMRHPKSTSSIWFWFGACIAGIAVFKVAARGLYWLG